MTDEKTMDARVTDAAAAAASAAGALAAWPAARRGELLRTCADVLDSRSDAVIAVTMEETGLTGARLSSEMSRTTGQLRLLADHVAEGRHQDDRRSDDPGGGPRIRTVSVPLGAVAVFAASNFPLAFGVAGGDTASALAAGCPVVVKGHPAQPRTSETVASALREAMAAMDAPHGTFALVRGAPDASLALVAAPGIRAVAFTGSLGGGRALLAAAGRRPDPIPVYAEMGSLNPVFVFEHAAGDPVWSERLAAAVTGSAGQLCTKPGLVAIPDTTAGRALGESLAARIAAFPSHPMLTEGMAAAHLSWFDRARRIGDRVTGSGGTLEDPRPFAVHVDSAELSAELLEEHFGPSVVIATVAVSDYDRVAAMLEGSLTATVLASGADLAEARALVPPLVRVAGRLVWNGVPTGVAVCDAMVHGGPWPATSAPWSTSVGTAAVQRFLRPVALQGVPEELFDAIAR